MAEWRKIHTKFWRDAEILDMTPEDKLFYLYILTNPSTTAVGCYEMPLKIAVLELGYNIETITQLIDRFTRYGKIRYDEKTKEVLIVNWLEHNSPASPKIKALIEQEIATIKCKEFVAEIRATLARLDASRRSPEKREKPVVAAGSVPVPQAKRLLPHKAPSHAALRAYIIRRDGFTCRRCGAKALDTPSDYDGRKALPTDNGSFLVMDHILTRQNGGTNDAANLQTLCDRCNAVKAGKQGSAYPMVYSMGGEVEVEVEVEGDVEEHMDDEPDDPTTGEASPPPPSPEQPTKIPYSPAFEVFWEAYPLKKSKQGAWQKWRALLKANGKADAETLIRAAQHYRAECEWEQREERYILHARTFLGPQRRWEEYLEPPKLAVRKGPPSNALHSGVDYGAIVEELQNSEVTS